MQALLCGVLGLARNWLSLQLPESQRLVSCWGQFAEVHKCVRGTAASGLDSKLVRPLLTLGGNLYFPQCGMPKANHQSPS